MTNFKLEKKEFNSREIARVLGISALRKLSKTEDLIEKWNKIKQKVANETYDEKYQNAAKYDSGQKSLEEEIFSLLLEVVILFQASMEATIKHASEENDAIGKVFKKKGSFAKNWKNGLRAVDKDTDTFTKYKNELYEKYRIKIIHLDRDKRIEAINNISFKDVYCGVRYGWWSYNQILNGMGYTKESKEESWKNICSGVNLSPDLF